jgi:methylmalonyl-CoA mutase cobalamin-binding subunit
MDDPLEHDDGSEDVPLTIGAVERATGIPSSTLRTWERRYGFPVAERTSGGHRLYSARSVDRLRLIQGALDRGMRPSQVVPADPERLRQLLVEDAPRVTTAHDSNDAWVGMVLRLDEASLLSAFRFEHSANGLLGFLRNRAAPFLIDVGHEWAEGRLDVFQEHFASEVLRDYLSSLWRPLADQGTRAPLVLATTPGEEHVLGLHMAACVVALRGHRVTLLGTEVPIASIAACAEEQRARAVLLSYASGADRPRAAEALRALAARLGPRVDIVVGGAGAPHDVAEVRVVTSLDALDQWAAGHHHH